MKVYFLGSISGKKRYLENYRQIVEALKELKVDLTENTLKPTETYIQSLDDEGKIDYYRQVLKWINEADVVVAEASYPSIGVGHEISLALEKSKPVVVLYEGGDAPHLLEGMQSEKLTVLEYKLDEVKQVVKDAIDYASEQMDTRFNFFIAPKHQNYLDWISRNKRVPRAVHLRRLLERDMAQNKEYQAELGGSKKKK